MSLLPPPHTHTRTHTHTHTHTHTYTHTHIHTHIHAYTHTHTLFVGDATGHCLITLVSWPICYLYVRISCGEHHKLPPHTHTRTYTHMPPSHAYTTHTGGVMEHWLKDEAVDNCMQCNAEFTFTERKHHCRDCGKIFCAKWAIESLVS